VALDLTRSHENDSKYWISYSGSGSTVWGSLSAKADQPRRQLERSWTSRPGASFANYNVEKPATIGVVKANRGFREQKPVKPKIGKSSGRTRDGETFNPGQLLAVRQVAQTIPKDSPTKICEGLNQDRGFTR